MGMHAILTKKFSFHYRAELSNDLVENELDHIFIGISDVIPVINSDEVAAYQYISTEDLASNLENYPENYTAWFKLLFTKVLKEINK